MNGSDALYDINKQFTDHLDVKERCLAIFLDLAEAFDTVPHDRLLNILSSYGIRGSILEAF